MFKEVEVIEDGYDVVVEVLRSAIGEIENAKKKDIISVLEKAICDLTDDNNSGIDEIVVALNNTLNTTKEKYETRLVNYKNDVARYVHMETVEVPDEPIVAENIEETVVEESNNETIVEE